MGYRQGFGHAIGFDVAFFVLVRIELADAYNAWPIWIIWIDVRRFSSRESGSPSPSESSAVAHVNCKQGVAKGGGYRHQYRFDLSDDDLEKQMKGYGLYHRLTNGEDLPSFIETVLDNNGAMVSTVEKLRAGIPVGGMSPVADMDTGGASYFFARIKKLPTAGRSSDVGLYFKKRMLRRMDAISYDHDAFGRVRDEYVSNHRGSTPAEWKQFARRGGNETIFKYSVALLDNIDVIVVGSDREKSSCPAIPMPARKPIGSSTAWWKTTSGLCPRIFWSTTKILCPNIGECVALSLKPAILHQARHAQMQSSHRPKITTVFYQTKTIIFPSGENSEYNILNHPTPPVLWRSNPLLRMVFG